MDPASQHILAEIKDRINLADLISEYGIELKRIGSSVKACCPFHNEKTPSFHINVDKGFYNCFGCGEHGDVFTFVQKYEGLSFPEALRKLAERAGVKLEERYDPKAHLRNRLYQINQELAAFYRRCLKQTHEGDIARDYLTSRAISDEIAEQFCIGYAPDGQNTLIRWAAKHGFSLDELVAAGVLAPPRTAGAQYYDRFHGRLTFPICDSQGRIIAFSCRLLHEAKHTGKYVNSPETEIFRKSTTLYALHLARPNITKAKPRRAIICEGQIDVIRCHACGFNIAVASQGTAFTEEHVAILKRYADSVDLVFDSDKAGVKATLRTMELFLSVGIPVRIVSLPPGDDPDSFLRQKGVTAFQACLNHAEDPAPFLVRSLKAQEATPEAMDATVRIARTAVMTVANCPTPVLTARFLQDVADALHLPIETLNDDLKRIREDVEEAERRRADFLARQNVTTSPTPQPVTPSLTNITPLSDSDILEDEWVQTDDFDAPSDDLPEDISNNDASTLNALTQQINTSRYLSLALCELLTHHFTDSEVMSCLIKHLPPSFIRDPYASKLYDLAIQATLNKRTTLAPDHSDPGFIAFLAQRSITPDRINSGSDDLSPLSFAHDVILQYWLHEFKYREYLLPPSSPEAFQLTLNRKRLQSLPSWEAAAPFMNALDPQFSSPSPSPTTNVPAHQSNITPPPAPQTESEPESQLPENPTLPPAEEEEWLPDDDEINIYEML